MSPKFYTLTIFLASMFVMPGLSSAYTYELEIRSSDLVERGREELKKGNIKKAITEYERGLKKGLSQSDLQDAHNDLCVAYYFLAEYDRALSHCNEAIKMVPNHWVHYNNRANIYALQKAGSGHIIATAACGSLRAEIDRGQLAVPDQFIDFTRKRETTYFDEGEVVRNFRMVIQLLRELMHAPHSPEALRKTTTRAIDLINRDIVDAEKQLRA